MIKRLLSVSLLTAAAMTMFCADAERLSPTQALDRITRQASSLSTGSLPADHATLQLAYTVNDSVSQSAGVYVFTSDDNSFLLAPADDLAPALLGYGNGFDPDNMPDNFRWWLGNYAAQIQYLSTHPEASVTATADHAPIPHLVSTTWNQGEPFNNLCPTDAGGRSVTGCVATAMSQIINYHQCPATYGIGTHSYTWNNKTLSFDYSTTRFRWSNMLDSYTGSYTTSQANAVATLMYAAGVSVNMNYSSSQSGAVSIRVPSALVNNFGFAKSARYVSRDCFTANDWDNLIYNELAAGRPVIYNGQSQMGGHSFVCDGYDGNSYYHINWGWGGMSDGSFLLSALDPYKQGTGGSGNNSGFNSDQDAIIGIQAPTGEETAAGLSLIANGSFQYSTTYNGFFWGNNKGCFNYSADPADFFTGLKLVNRSTGAIVCVEGDRQSLKGISDEGYMAGFSIIRVSSFPADLPAGTYDAYPIARDVQSESWQPNYIPLSYRQSAEVRVGKNGLVTFDGSDPDAITSYITVTDIYQRGNIIMSDNPSIVVTFSNKSSEDLTNNFDFRFVNALTSEVTTIGTYSLPVNKGKSDTYNLGLSAGDLTDGKYYVTAINTSVKATVSDTYTIYIGVQPTAVAVAPASVSVNGGSAVSLKATVTPANAFDTSVIWTSAAPAIATVSADGTVSGLNQGQAVITATTVNGLTATANVNVTGNAAVDAVESDCGNDAPVRYYDLKGIEIKEPANPGLFIRYQGGKAQKVVR